MRGGHVLFQRKSIKQGVLTDAAFPHHRLHPGPNDQSESATSGPRNPSFTWPCCASLQNSNGGAAIHLRLRCVDARFPTGVLPLHGSRRIPCRVRVNENIRMAPSKRTPHSETASVIYYTNKLENNTPATTSIIQARLLAFKSSHCVHASEENTLTSQVEKSKRWLILMVAMM
jgi:hypothetical protein